MSDGAPGRPMPVWLTVAVSVVLIAGALGILVLSGRVWSDRNPTGGGARDEACAADVRRAVDAVSEARIRAAVEWLSRGGSGRDDVPFSRHVSAPGNAAAVTWIASRLAESGAEVTEQPFRSGGYRLANVVGTLTGPDGPHIGVGAHLDSISERPGTDAPGADDNATGVAVVLEAARVLADVPAACRRGTIDLVAFNDEEEDEMGGSVTYAAGAQGTLDGFLNVDMIGHGAEPCVVSSYRGRRDKPVAEQLEDARDRYDIDLQIRVDRYRDDDQDAASFWDVDVPVGYVYECRMSPHWHRSSDEPEHVNTAQVTRTAQAVVAALLTMTGD